MNAMFEKLLPYILLIGLPCCMFIHLWIFNIKNAPKMEEEYKERCEVKRINGIINRKRESSINIPSNLHW
jgi:hypothetical protein